MNTDQTASYQANAKSVRGKLNLTIHPEIKEFAMALANARRDTISQLFEDLVEVEWNKVNGIVSNYPPPKTYILSHPGIPVANPRPTAH
jgi:hypothetical protein